MPTISATHLRRRSSSRPRIHGPAPASPSHARGRRGLSLIESLVALLVLATGTLALARLHRSVDHATDLAGHRADAARLGQARLEQARTTVDRQAGQPESRSPIDPTPPPDPPAIESATFRVDEFIRPTDLAPLKAVTVALRWQDRAGADRQLALDALIAPNDPVWRGVLAMRGTASIPAQVMRRVAGLPLPARDLGNGHSAFKPTPDAPVVWIVENATGLVTQRCPATDLPAADAPPALPGNPGTGPDTASPGPSTASACEAVQARIISGYVGFGAVRPAARSGDIPRGRDDILDLDLTLRAITSAPAPRHECHDDAESARRAGRPFVSYHCLVVAEGQPPRWSGRLDIVPHGWAIASDGRPGSHRVCRYSADANGDGRIDNAEHPADYRDVDQALAAQNFLVVLGTAACPGDHEPGDGEDDATLPHQPRA